MFMVRMLNLISVLALLSAGLLSILCAKNGPSNDAFMETTTLSIIERFRQSGDVEKASDRDQTSSLVRQAQLLANYLDPPVPPKQRVTPATPKAERVMARAPEVKPPNTSPKFELRGISYRPSQPEDSMALVWQADTGHRWVRQGAQLGHLVIAEIHGDGVLYSDGDQTHQMALNLVRTRTVMARDREDEPVKKESKRTAPVVAHWTPVRRIRQIPRARVAARIGRRTPAADRDTR